MAAFTTCSDFGAQENEIGHRLTFSPFVCHEVMGLDAVILVFLMSFKSSFFTLFFHSHQEDLYFFIFCH